MIIIDGDACPNIDLITNIAKEYKQDVTIYVDDSHNIINDYAKVIVVSKAYQSVDMRIINDIKDNDILITSDYGLASLSLLKNTTIINPNGYLYTKENIDNLLNSRYINQKLRREKIRLPNIKKRKYQDVLNLKNTLINILENKKVL